MTIEAGIEEAIKLSKEARKRFKSNIEFLNYFAIFIVEPIACEVAGFKCVWGYKPTDSQMTEVKAIRKLIVDEVEKEIPLN